VLRFPRSNLSQEGTEREEKIPTEPGPLRRETGSKSPERALDTKFSMTSFRDGSVEDRAYFVKNRRTGRFIETPWGRVTKRKGKGVSMKLSCVEGNLYKVIWGGIWGGKNGAIHEEFLGSDKNVPRGDLNWPNEMITNRAEGNTRYYGWLVWGGSLKKRKRRDVVADEVGEAVEGRDTTWECREREKWRIRAPLRKRGDTLWVRGGAAAGPR